MCRIGVLQLKLIKALLDSHGLLYRVSEHEPVYTSEQAARVRGVELKSGVKTLVLKTREGGFIMALIAGDRRIDLKKLARITGTKKLRLASPGDVLNITRCEVGSVHPFGNLHRLSTYLDTSLLDNNEVTFNAGLHTVSIEMEIKDLVMVIKPIIETFS